MPKHLPRHLLLLLLAALSFAPSAFGQIASHVTPPMWLPQGETIRCSVRNSAALEIREVTTLVLGYADSLVLDVVSHGDLEIATQRGAEHTNNAAAGWHYCATSYEGPCEAVDTSACVLGQPISDLKTCLSGKPLRCAERRYLQTPSVHARPFATVACSATAVIDAIAVVTLLDPDGNTVASTSENVGRDETLTLRHQSFIEGDFSCRFEALLGAREALRARVWVEDVFGTSTDGADAR